MRDKVLCFIRERELLRENDSVLVALSGGADSVSLLHFLISIRELYHLTIHAFHFNHMIRGEEAERDERFCRLLCERFGVPYHAERADIPAIAKKNGESAEACGRRLRYEALGRIADGLGGARIATAHNLNDNTETMLLNLVRGTGIGGLCGIPAKRENIIRPLLTCSRSEIEVYCRENRLDYVTDSTNLSDAYTRNKLRLSVLPILRELNPSLDEGISRTAALMRDADAYLDKISTKELKSCRTDYGYDCAALLRLDQAVLSYAVKHILEDADAPVDSRHIELIIERMSDSGSVDLGAGFRAVCAQGVLRITDGGEVAAGDLCVPIGAYFTGRVNVDSLRGAAAGDAKIHKKFWNNLFPCDIITLDTVVRRRRAGDTFTDPRRGVTKTLKKLFNELKIPREKRDSLTLIAEGSTVLWIEGIGTAKQAQIADDYHGDAVVIEF